MRPSVASVMRCARRCALVPRPGKSRPQLETWAYALSVGQPLPTLPLWLCKDLAVSLELEASYEETCRALRIP